jgi:hypothetical protein
MSGKGRKILVILSLVLVASIMFTTLGIAYAGGIKGTGLIAVTFFFSTGVIIVLAQLIPAGILLSSFISTAFSSIRRNELPVQAT